MRTTLRKASRVVAVAGVCAGLALSGSAMAVAAPAAGDGTQANLVYSVDGGATWSDSVTAQRGEQVLARLFYDTTKESPVTGTSLTTQIPDGFMYVPGSTRNVLAPGSDVAAGVASAETKDAAVSDAVWSGDQLQVSPSAGFNGESDASQSGLLRNGVKRYLNLHQCDYFNAPGTAHIVSSVSTATGFPAGTNVGNSSDSSAECGPANGAFVPFAGGTSVTPLDLLGNRYVNLHQCDYFHGGTSNHMLALGRNTTVFPGTGTNASNAADSVADCEPPGGWVVFQGGTAVASLDLVGARYLNLQQCDYYTVGVNDANHATTNVPAAVFSAGTGVSDSPQSQLSCPSSPGVGWTVLPSASGAESFDMVDTSRGAGFIEFAFTSEVPVPACEETVSLPAQSSTREGALNGAGTGSPVSSAGVTLAAFTATGEACPEELTANTDEVTTPQDASLTIDVLGNDVVPAGSTATVSGPNDGPWNGELVLNADGTFTYTPTPGFVGTDSFSYTITDQDGNTSVGTVNITITEDDAGIPLVAPAAAAFAGLLGLGGLGLKRRREHAAA